MLHQLTLEQRLLGLNILFFGLIGLTAALLLNQDQAIPTAPRVKLPSLAEIAVEAPPPREYSAFGSREMMGTLMTRPPTPTIPPSPPPPTPNLSEAVRFWRPQGILPGYAYMADQRTKEEWQMEKGRETETKVMTYNNTKVPVKLAETDPVYMRAKFSYTNDRGTQEVWLSMFDEGH